MTKFSQSERQQIIQLVNIYSLKRLPNDQIAKKVFEITNKDISIRYIDKLKQKIKKESYDWYRKMREGEYEYIHEFKERIDEILWLQRRHYNIVESEDEPTPTKQASMAELHRLNITLANYFDVAPEIINDTKAISKTLEKETTTTFDGTN